MGGVMYLLYLLFLLLFMIVITICFSIIIGKRKSNGVLSSEKLTDDVKVIENNENIIVDEDII